jgi:tetratricopeptide (TPR) repeat protein
MKRYFLLTILLTMISPSPSRASYKGDHHWWLKSYGTITEQQNPHIARAIAIFDETWRAAQPVTIAKPRLIVLPSSSEKWLDSWALSIADGSIIVVESLLSLAFDVEEPNKAYGDSRLAFVLAHEMAHLIHGDHGKLGVPLLFQALSGEKELQAAKDAETAADYKGLFTMTMAGYNPQNVLGRRSVFFNEYAHKVRKKIRSIGTGNNPSRHPEAGIRAEELRLRLKSFADKLPLFYQGVEAYRALEFDKAENRFSDFLQVYPGREVYNNLGLTLYQQSRYYISGCQGLNYKLLPATELAESTTAELLVHEEIGISVDIKKRPFCLPNKFRMKAAQAGEHLGNARQKDSDYIPALVNLTALHITEQDFKTAEIEAERILTANIKNPHAINNKALVLYLLDSDRNKMQVVQLLKQVPDSSPVFALASQNLELINGEKPDPMVAPVPNNDAMMPEIIDKIR